MANMLQENKQRFRGSTMFIGDWFWEMDNQHRFIHLSEFGGEYDPQEMTTYVGKTAWEMADADLESELRKSHVDDSNNFGEFKNFDFMRKLRDGTVLRLRANGVPVFNTIGDFQG